MHMTLLTPGSIPGIAHASEEAPNNLAGTHALAGMFGCSALQPRPGARACPERGQTVLAAVSTGAAHAPHDPPSRSPS